MWNGVVTAAALGDASMCATSSADRGGHTWPEVQALATAAPTPLTLIFVGHGNVVRQAVVAAVARRHMRAATGAQ